MTITLKTLHEASAQEVFDLVATHLLKQGERSWDGRQCKYLGPNGLKCAAGILIGDDEHPEELESMTWARLAIEGRVPSEHLKLISSLQTTHDCVPETEWKRELEKVAKLFSLSREKLS